MMPFPLNVPALAGSAAMFAGAKPLTPEEIAAADAKDRMRNGE